MKLHLHCKEVINLKRIFCLFIIMGAAYLVLEGIWRGWTNIAMLPVGGLCGVLIGLLNEYKQFYKLKIWQQCLTGTAIILSIEFLSGCILNLWLGLHIWIIQPYHLTFWVRYAYHMEYCGLYYAPSPSGSMIGSVGDCTKKIPIIPFGRITLSLYKINKKGCLK